jgi:agmatinase
MENERRFEPYGPVNFLKAASCSLEEISDPATAVAVVGIPIDNVLGLGHTRLGPRAIRDGTEVIARFMEISPTGLIEVSTGRHIKPLSKPRIFDLGDLPIDRASVENNNQIIREGIQRITETGAFPVILGGDHYITAPAFWGASDGFAKGQNGFKMGYIQMDAHLDLFDEIPQTSRYNTATCARRISELEIIEIRNMVWIGTRGWARPAEGWDYIQENGGHFLTMNKIRERGIKDVAKEALELASNDCDAVYLSIDMDVVDAPYVQGITIPEPGGISGQELIDAMTIFRESPLIRAMDLVEVCPDKDTYPWGGATSRLAARALIEFIAPKVFEFS